MVQTPPSSKLLIGLLSMVMLVAVACQPGAGNSPAGPPLRLSLALQPAPYSGLIAIAAEKGFFKEAGLEVSLIPYPSGKKALEAVCLGQAQVATVADIAFAARAVADPSIRVLASIGASVGSQLIARKDRNIQHPADLRGKKVGFSAETTSDYFLYAFMMTEYHPEK